MQGMHPRNHNLVDDGIVATIAVRNATLMWTSGCTAASASSCLLQSSSSSSSLVVVVVVVVVVARSSSSSSLFASEMARVVDTVVIIRGMVTEGMMQCMLHYLNPCFSAVVFVTAVSMNTPHRLHCLAL